MVPYGLLMSYGQEFPEHFRKATTYSAKILAGARPADCPVEQPTRLEFVVNLKAAKSLGISLPPSLMISADETIDDISLVHRILLSLERGGRPPCL